MQRRVNIEKSLNKFGRGVVYNSRKNLAKTSSNFTGKLSSSISYETNVGPNSFSLSFKMEKWGQYQDQGVRGIGGVRKTTSKFKKTNNKGKLWKQKVKKGLTPFSFKKGAKHTPSVKHFNDWAKAKGLSPFAVREAVYHQGIPAKKFFTNAFEEQFKKLPEQLVEAYALDVEDLLKFSLK